MQSDTFQIVLNLKNCSGRGVRLKAVGPAARDQATLDAAKLAGKDASAIEFGVIVTRELLKASFVAVTQQTGLKTRDDLLKIPETGWQKFTIGELETGAMEEMFTARDYEILRAVIRQLYNVDDDDVDAIMGGALPVSEG